MRSYAILVDAGFIKRKLGSYREPLKAQRLSSLVDYLGSLACFDGWHLHRVYFYDAPPLEGAQPRPLGDGSIDFGQSRLSRINKSLHSALTKAPYVALRLGQLTFRGWRLKRDVLETARGAELTITDASLEPDVQQKGVDMRIGLDIASLTLKKQVDAIVLVTGDSDFVPAMKFARREGAQLYLVTFGHGIKAELREHADVLVDIEPADVPGAG